MQPENGGRSVFYHEYAHDLGLPDDYNILNGGDNNNEHWTLMAQSRLGAENDEAIGERGGDLGAWNKLQLGWLNHATVDVTTRRKLLLLGPQEYNTNLPQALVVVLPDQHVTFDLGTPAFRALAVLLRTLGRQPHGDVAAGDRAAGGGTLTLKTRYDIELDFGRCPGLVDGTPVVGTVNGKPTPIPDNQNGWTVGWDGTSANYVDGSFPMPAGNHEVSIEYLTDAAVAGNEGTCSTACSSTRSRSTAPSSAKTAGRSTASGSSVRRRSRTSRTSTSPGHRSYVSYDQYLKTGPYFFGYGPALPDKVDHYSYEEGLLISYNNTLFTDNDTFEHPGSGRNLYIDAHPTPMPQASGPGGFWRARVQVYDAPFGLHRPIRSRCMSTANRSRSAVCRPCPRSTTPISTGSGSCPTTASSSPPSVSRSGSSLSWAACCSSR